MGPGSSGGGLGVALGYKCKDSRLHYAVAIIGHCLLPFIVLKRSLKSISARLRHVVTTAFRADAFACNMTLAYLVVVLGH
jgi:hypothetical protein